MSEDGVLLTEEDRALLLKVSSLLEVIIETFDVLRDEETMRSVREAEEDLRAGRVRGYGEFIEELKKSGKI
jgi:PHD/YefM family antitoxin component YafN of YafNO toxin-antitoxin module